MEEIIKPWLKELTLQTVLGSGVHRLLNIRQTQGVNFLGGNQLIHNISTPEALSTIWKTEGFLGFWRGALWLNTPYYLKTTLKTYLEKKKIITAYPDNATTPELIRWILMRLSFDLASSIALMPFTVVGMRLSLDFSENGPRFKNGGIELIQEIFEQEGLSGFFRGFRWYFLAQILNGTFFDIFAGIFFTNAIKKDLEKGKEYLNEDDAPNYHKSRLKLAIIQFLSGFVTPILMRGMLVREIAGGSAIPKEAPLTMFNGFGLKVAGGTIYILGLLTFASVSKLIFGE